MKMKTWEKWYWGVDIALIMITLVGYGINPEISKTKIGGVERIATWGEIITGVIILYVLLSGLIWLIIRYLVNKGERE